MRMFQINQMNIPQHEQTILAGYFKVPPKNSTFKRYVPVSEGAYVSLGLSAFLVLHFRTFAAKNSKINFPEKFRSFPRKQNTVSSTFLPFLAQIP